MIELQRRSTPPTELTDFCATNPVLTPADFDRIDFQPVKKVVRRGLHADQAGLCVYCERHVPSDAGEVEHIKPKGKPPFAHLAFDYTNFAFGCRRTDTCGAKKKAGVLPIEPGPGCNADVSLSTDGSIQPRPGLTAHRRHEVVQTRDMLGLEHPSLVRERQQWVESYVQALRAAPERIHQFIHIAPFRCILQRVAG